MARKKTELVEASIIQGKIEQLDNLQEPKTFRTPRPLLSQFEPLKQNLFDMMESNEETAIEERKGTYKIGGLTRKVSARELYGLLFALAQINSNQSYQLGNRSELSPEDAESDRILNHPNSKKGAKGKKEEDEDEDEETKRRRIARALSRNAGANNGQDGRKIKNSKDIEAIAGEKVPVGEIYASLNDICRLANGTDSPSTKDKKGIESLLKTLHSTPLEIEYKDYVYTAPLVNVLETVRDKRNGAKYYHLYLPPIFVDIITKGYAQFPQNIMKRLRNGIPSGEYMTDLHIKLLTLLAQQEHSKKGESTYIMTALKILQYLGLEDSYRNQRKRTMTQLDKICKAVQATEIITRYEIKYKAFNGKKAFDKIIFYLNPNFVQEDPLSLDG